MIDYSNAFVFSTSLLVVVFRYGIMAEDNMIGIAPILYIQPIKNSYNFIKKPLLIIE